jgi:hypothetical protein
VPFDDPSTLPFESDITYTPVIPCADEGTLLERVFGCKNALNRASELPISLI